MKVVHVAECGGGVETYLTLLARGWDRPDIELAFVLNEASALGDALRSQGYEVATARLPRTRSRLAEVRAAPRLRTLLRGMHADVVHLHSSQAGFIGRLALAGTPQATIYTPHAFYFLGKSGPARAFFRFVERLLDAVHPSVVLGTSPSEAARAIHDVHLPASRVTSVLNAVEVQDLAGLEECSNSAACGPVVMVGRVSHQKNIDMFLDVVVMAHQAGSSLQFWLVGVGHYASDRELLGEKLRARGLEDSRNLRVVAWMDRSHILRLMAGAGVVVLTSRYESFGYVVAEAAALGVPAVATDVDGLRDIVRDGDTGYLVELGDAASMWRCVERLAEDTQLRDTMGRQARDHAMTAFPLERLYGELAEQYRSLHERHGEHHATAN